MAAPKSLTAGALDADTVCDHCQRIVKNPLPAAAFACPCCRIRKADKGVAAAVQPTTLCASCPIDDPLKTVNFGRKMDVAFSVGPDKFVENNVLICRHCIQYVLTKSTQELVNLVKEKGGNYFQESP